MGDGATGRLSQAVYDLVVLNGFTVGDTFARYGLFQVEHIEKVAFGGSLNSTLYRGQVSGRRALGWTLNVPYARTSNNQRAGLAEWLSQHALQR